VAYQKRKSSGERLQHRAEGKKGTVKFIEVNLDQKLHEVQKILKVSEELPQFNVEAIKIISTKYGSS